MSAYAQAFLGVADMLTGASKDAAYEAAYGTYYSAYQGMHNAANAKVAAEANIAAIKEDRINTDTVIAMQQDQAEAQAKVMAAVSGTEGQSVDATIYQTEVNSSVASSNNRKNAEQQIENQLASVYQSQSTMLAMDNPQVDNISTGLNLGTTLIGMAGDESFRGEFMEGIDNMFINNSSDYIGGNPTTTGGVFLPTA